MHQTNRVLIVEDEEILASNIKTHIQRRGWEAHIAPTGKHAVSALGDFVPQVILLDYNLPDMTGFQILEALCARYGPCPCVLMTGHPTEHIMADAKQYGIGRILCKPFALADMEASISGAVDSRPRPKPHVQSAPASPVERRRVERRSLAGRFFKAIRLGDGTWLTCDRRKESRRQ